MSPAGIKKLRQIKYIAVHFTQIISTEQLPARHFLQSRSIVEDVTANCARNSILLEIVWSYLYIL